MQCSLAPAPLLDSQAPAIRISFPPPPPSSILQIISLNSYLWDEKKGQSHCDGDVCVNEEQQQCPVGVQRRHH